MSATALIKKLATIKKDIEAKDTKKIQECGNSDITGRTILVAQLSIITTCNNANVADPKLENSTKKSPNKITAIIANTYINTADIANV